MDRQTFQTSLADERPPQRLSPPLRALWYAARGEWAAAHAEAQALPGTAGAWIHAHLHREEGDLGNARYWYRQAGQPLPTDSLEAEREALLLHFLANDAG